MRTLIKNIKSTHLFCMGSIALTGLVVLSCDDVDYTFVPDPVEPHTITEVAPTIGDIGHEVTITGENFSRTPSNNKVRFNGVLAFVKQGTDSLLVVDVPEGATTGDLTISHVDLTVNAGTFTVVPFPVIESFSPEVGEVGAEVTITGEKFSTVLDENLVWFNGVAATVTAATETTITVTVPTGATSGPIRVEVNGQSDVSEEDFTVAITLKIPLTSNDDDVEEIAEVDPNPDPLEPTPMVGVMDLGSSDLEFGEISSDQGLMNIGLRFNNVTLPQGATITEAHIQFNADNTGANAVELTIYGENVADAAPYAETIGNLSARALTTANEVWSIAPWINPGDRGEAQRTVNIASIVQEIVDRGDWAPGNSMNIIMKHTGVSVGVTSSSGGREAENYSSSTPEHGAELTIIYQ